MTTDPSDIVERLEREVAEHNGMTWPMDEHERAFVKDDVRMIAVDEITRLTVALIRTEAQLKNSASSLQSEAEKLFKASLEANKVSDPRPKND